MAPRPGTPVRGSRTGRPIMALLDLLGRRWALRIVWELTQAEAGFRALQERCGDMSPSVLSQRLRELVEARIVAADEAGCYRLTEQGTALARVLAPVAAWAGEWAHTLGDAPAAREGGAARERRRSALTRADSR